MVQLDQVVDSLVAGGLLPFCFECTPVIPKIKKTEIFLELLVKMLYSPEMIKKCMEKQLILKILV